MTLCGRKALTLLSSVFAVCALGLLGIAVSTDYWLYLEEGVILPLNQSTEIRMSLHSGLWRVCFLAGEEKGRCFTIEYVMPTNVQMTSESTVSVLKMIRSATPFPLVSLFFMFIGFVLNNIGHIRPHRTILAFVSGIFFILSDELKKTQLSSPPSASVEAKAWQALEEGKAVLAKANALGRNDPLPEEGVITSPRIVAGCSERSHREGVQRVAGDVEVRLAACRAGWGPEDTAVHVALALEGPALQVLLDLSPTEQRDYMALTTALERRFGERRTVEQRRDQLTSRQRASSESLGSLAADVRYYARQGYPQLDAAAQEELALHAFLQALTPEKLRQHVGLSAPMSTLEALAEAERAEAVLFPQNIVMSPRLTQPVARQVEHDDQDGYHNEQVCQVNPTTTRSAQPRSSRR
ncbi:hypothetical protein ACEWY4_018304 [Coilia grayii]|uniref:Uncharacterized protein n=1 Tax=Coilia grayii TaxID=363190 RepID=A0ABD1JJG1_9TELE